MTEGLDIYSSYQTVTDWNAVRRAGKTFAYFKGTDGLTPRDTKDWPAGARAAGIACGLYGYAEPGSATDQYDYLLRLALERRAIDLSPALDLEAPFVPGPSAAQFAISWLGRAASVGQIPVFYANDSMMSYILASVRAAVPGTWPWIARYGALPRNPYRTWQFSSSRQVAGIVASGVDEDTGDAPIIAGGGGAAPGPTPPPGTQLTIAQMEESMYKPVIYGPTPVKDEPDGTKSQVQYGQQVIDPCGGQLHVVPLDDNVCFFGNGNPNPPVFCYGAGGGKGGGHSVVDPKAWEQNDERRATRNNCQAYDIPKGTTRVAYALSTNGQVAVKFVPSYLLG